MIADMPPLDADEQALLDRAADWPEFASSADLTAEALRHIAAAHGHDVAVALLYDRLRRAAENGPFIRRVEEWDAEDAGPLAESSLLAIVPGAFYRARPESGADGGRLLEIAARLGCQAERIPLAEFGSPAENGRIIRDWLSDRSEERITLVALSKGSLDVHAALDLPDVGRAFRNVAAWVNLSGLFQGTALVGWLRRHRLRSLLVRGFCWWHGHRFATIAELDRRRGGGVALPNHMRVIHIVGFPLRRRLGSPEARRGFARLAPLGPNDGGGNLLADVARWPGVVYPIWGTDHYFRPAWDMDALITRILRCVMADQREPVPLTLSVGP
jgi:hypothetical protein